MGLADQDIDEEIAADWADIQARARGEDPPERAPPEPQAETVTDAEPQGETPAETSARAEAAKARARKEDGKFAKEPKAAKGAAPAEDAPQTAPAAAEAALDLNRAPSSWKPAAKAAWAQLPEPIRQEIQRREQDFLKGNAQLRPDADLGRGIRTTADQYRAIIDAEGGNPVAAFQDYLRTASALRLAPQSGKQDAVMTIIQRFGVNVPQLLQRLGGAPGQAANGSTPAPAQADANANPGFRDPRVDALLSQIQTREQQEAQARAERERAERDQIQSSVQAWMDERDAKGAPLRPYIDNVFPEMNLLVPQIRQANPGMTNQQVMQLAYDKACWASDEVRPLLQQSLEAKRQAENRQKVVSARRASSVNTPRRGSVPNGAIPATMDQTIEETARALGMIT